MHMLLHLPMHMHMHMQLQQLLHCTRLMSPTAGRVPLMPRGHAACRPAL